MTKVIGIPAYKNEQANSFGVGISYLEWISQFGNPRIIMPWEEFVEVDLLLLPGGMDLSPSSYGEIPGFRTQNTDVFKQFFYDKRLKTYIDNGTSVFGICLGHQQLCTYFGSTVTQDLIYHGYSKERTDLSQEIFVGKEKKKIKVNSFHHQAIMEHNLSDQLEVIAWAKDPQGNIVEAMRHKHLPIASVQYHPEDIYDGLSYSLITELLEANVLQNK